MMSSSDENFDFDSSDSDETTDYEDFQTTTDNDDDDDDNDDDDEISDAMIQPIHFRECLRLLDAALTSNYTNVVTPWCASEKLELPEEPRLKIGTDRNLLSFPLTKRTAKRIIQRAKPFEMKINIIDGISFSPSAYELSADLFSLENPEWQTKVEPFLKEFCVSKKLQLDPKGIELKLSSLLLLESCQFPREFPWKKEKTSNSIIGKLLVTLPSIHRGSKETISYLKEKHVFDSTEKDCRNSYFYTIVPVSDECRHEIDFLSNGCKLILVYDVIALHSMCFYDLILPENSFEQINRILETWLRGLENHFHGYSSKIVVPFTDSFQLGHNPLLHGTDRIIGTILRRTVEKYQNEKCFLYQGLIQPNRNNLTNEHVCRSLTDLTLLTNNFGQTLFDRIESCLGNCNETFSGNIFLRRTYSELGNPISIEQYLVPIWCLVPVSAKYELFADRIPYVLKYFQENLIFSVHHRQEVFLLFDWLLSTTKKIHFDSKTLLHQLIRMIPISGMDNEMMILMKKLFAHREFLDQFYSINHKEESHDLVFLLKSSRKTEIQLYLHQAFRNILKRRSFDTDRIKNLIKFIGILSSKDIDQGFIFVLIHELLTTVFQSIHVAPSLTDLVNLLALLSLFIDAYEPSCEILSQQIIHQIKITVTTTANVSTISNLLRIVLVPTIVQIYRHWTNDNEKISSNNRKRKHSNHPQLPSWFASLYQTCVSLLNDYCNSRLPIPFYSSLSLIFHSCQCSVCEELLTFLENTSLFEKSFLIPKHKVYHFSTTIRKFTPLITLIESMTSDQRFQKVTLMKMSTYDEELWRETNLLYSLLQQIPISNDVHNRSNQRSNKRFKGN